MQGVTLIYVGECTFNVSSTKTNFYEELSLFSISIEEKPISIRYHHGKMCYLKKNQEENQL